MSDSSTESILTSETGQVLTVTINRPEARNAMRVSDKRRMTEIIAEAGVSGVRCVVITGAGDKAFCAGSDLKEMAGMDLAAVLEMEMAESTMLDTIMKSRVPVIAAV